MRKLLVFPSTRKLRQYYSTSTDTIFTDKAISVEDFFELVLVSSMQRKASAYESLILMHKACQQTHKSKDLHIAENFFAFLKNKEYLFSFFKELSLEKKQISDIACRDYYALYDEHLQIIDELLKNYLELLKENNLYDDISLALTYEINYDYFKDYDELHFELAGFLSAFEFDVLLELSKHIELVLIFHTSKFNISYMKSLPCFQNLDIKKDKKYKFSLSKKEILQEEDFVKSSSVISYKSFELRSLQAAFVFNELSKFIKEGIEPKDIVIITPDESFCDILMLYDYNKMLNYANGTSIKHSLFYKKLKAIFEAASSDFNFVKKEDFLTQNLSDVCEHEAYFEAKDMVFDLQNSTLRYLKIDDFLEFKQKLELSFDYDYFENLIQSFLKEQSSELISLVELELKFVYLLRNQGLSLRELMELFLANISSLKLSLPDFSQVTVMGLLESRTLDFEAVIVVDFNDDLIPKRTVNELFLNNEIRSKSGLISYDRRENLQRFYYESLFKKAKKISISFLENEEKIRSRFLDELDFNLQSLDDKYHIQAYFSALKIKDYKETKINLEPIKAPKLKHNIFEKELSFSRLASFLEYKRTYYYKYILKIPEPRALFFSEDKSIYGTFIHECFKQYYSEHKDSFDELEFTQMLENKQDSSHLCPLEIELFKSKLHKLAQNELSHFKQGFSVKYIEKEFKKELVFKHKDKTYKIKLTGRIDRIDEASDCELILDYKSGDIPKDSYQLAFYQALYKEDAKACYYDLKDSMSFVREAKTKSVDDLRELFKGLVDEMQDEIVFENSRNGCCPYKSIYEKNLK